MAERRGAPARDHRGRGPLAGTPSRPAASGCGRCSCSSPGSAASAHASSCRARPRAVELIHSATLVHDDVLDDAPLRRGRRTVYAAAGRDAATATGDLLFSSAFAELARNGDDRPAARAVLGLGGARPRRADAARRRLARRRHARALPRALRAQDGAPVRGRLRARRAGRRRPAARARSATPSASPSSCSTTCSTSPGPAERTGKRRGTDLLDGTVTLPLILARERSPELVGARPARDRRPGRGRAVCELIEATGAGEQARQQALELVERASGAAATCPPASAARSS